MVAVLILIAAFVPAIIGLACHWSGSSPAAGIAVTAALLLPVALCGHLWAPATVTGMWLGAMGLQRRPWAFWTRRRREVMARKARTWAREAAVAEIVMELDSTDHLVPLIKNAPKRVALPRT